MERKQGHYNKQAFELKPERSRVRFHIIWELSKDVFERRTSNGSVVSFLLLCFYVSKFVLLSVLTHKEKTLRITAKPVPENAKSLLPVDVRHSKTSLLINKLHIAYLSFLSHMLTISSPSVSSNISAQDS